MPKSWYERIVGSSPVPASAARREILVIDDHADARKMVALILERLGWTAQGAASGEEALTVLAGCHATVGMALVDVILPDTDGMSLARRLRGLYPQLAIVVMSGQLNDESRWIVSEEGFRFLPKPFSLPQLRDVIAEMLGDEGSGTPS
ncbi:MAG: two component sensor kinase [Rariglobus sp.]|jgi:CheY-like chemotaxis protein|nr:two component sensor kinase [Rariglobus sp.]